MDITWSRLFYNDASYEDIPLLNGANWKQWNVQLLAMLRPLSFVVDILQAGSTSDGEEDPLYSSMTDSELFIFLTWHLDDQLKSITMDVRAQYGLKGSILYKALESKFQRQDFSSIFPDSHTSKVDFKTDTAAKNDYSRAQEMSASSKEIKRPETEQLEEADENVESKGDPYPLKEAKRSSFFNIDREDIPYELKHSQWPLLKKCLLGKVSEYDNVVEHLALKIKKGHSKYDESLDKELFLLLVDLYPASKYLGLTKVAQKRYGQRGGMLFQALERHMQNLERKVISVFTEKLDNYDKKAIFAMLEKRYLAVEEGYGLVVNYNDKLDYFAKALKRKDALIHGTFSREVLEKEFNILSWAI